jgi:transposase InsO family protein
MTTAPQRQNLLALLGDACNAGARMHKACQQIGLSLRTMQRWLKACSGAAPMPKPEAPTAADLSAASPVLPEQPGQDTALVSAQSPMTSPAIISSATALLVCGNDICQDRRLSGLRQGVVPHNKLTPQETQQVLQTINSDEFKDLPPSQIVPRLADRGCYLASESTLQRILRSHDQNTHRRAERKGQKRSKPFALKATMANQIYTWDITYLPTTIKGQYFYLYLFVDIFSRFIVGAQVFDCESAELSADLLKDICQRHGVAKDQVTLHSDNGGPMKGQTILSTMQELGVTASRSRPSVSNDNPYSESLFRTLKYRPQMPVRPFETLQDARLWAIGLVDWYNHEHRHSAIKFVTPAQRHDGLDPQLLQKRAQVYAQARNENPQRWSKNTRNWSPVTEVHLNPNKPANKESKSAGK